MTKPAKYMFIFAGVVTIAALITWQATGGDAYTKFQVVEQVERTLDADDPLAGTGFYPDDKVVETVTKDEFHLGLIPTPVGLFDKNAVSVMTIVIPIWVFALVFWWYMRRRE